MRDFVSDRMNLVLLWASLTVMAGIFFAGLPWGAFIFVSAAAAMSLWLSPRNPEPVPVAARSRSAAPASQRNF